MYEKIQEMIDQIPCQLIYASQHPLLATIIMLMCVIVLGIGMQGKDYFLIKRKYGEDGPWYKVMRRKLETAWKCTRLLCYPIAPTAGITIWWKLILYDNGVHLHKTFEGVATAGWIMGSSVIYSVFTVTVFQLVVSKYQDTRKSSRRAGGHDDFMDLRDEELSPVMYTLVLALSLFFLAGFLVIDYPDALHGLILICSISYMLSLVLFVLTEIDDPFRGVFVIKSIPADLLRVHAKKYREARNAPGHKKFLETLNAMGPEVLCPPPVVRRTTILGMAIFRQRRGSGTTPEEDSSEAPPG
jgi:hypothetical protein